MTKQGSFKQAVRRHAAETGQRYTEARADLDGLDSRVFHTTTAQRVVEHLTDRYGLDITGVGGLGHHTELVFRIDHADGPSWVARVFPPARPLARVEGDPAVLEFLAAHNVPAERLACEEPVAHFDGQGVLVTTFVEGADLDEGLDGFAAIGDWLGRLHALEPDHTVSRDGGAFGHDPAREGTVRQDLAAALTFLRTIEDQVADSYRGRFDGLYEQVREADDATGLPESIVHGDVPTHVLVNAGGPVGIHWSGSGRGSRAAELAYQLWLTLGDQANVDALLASYTRHVTLTDVEVERLPGLLVIKPLYLVCWYYWQSISSGYQPSGGEGWWNYIHPDAIAAMNNAARRFLDR